MPTKLIAIAVAVVLTVAGVASGAVTGGVGATDVHVTQARKVVVTGCHAEDSCAIDYKARGVWVIRRVNP